MPPPKTRGFANLRPACSAREGVRHKSHEAFCGRQFVKDICEKNTNEPRSCNRTRQTWGSGRTYPVRASMLVPTGARAAPSHMSTRPPRAGLLRVGGQCANAVSRFPLDGARSAPARRLARRRSRRTRRIRVGVEWDRTALYGHTAGSRSLKPGHMCQTTASSFRRSRQQ